jgi:hypothetical protein
VIQCVAHFVDLSALNQRRLAEDRADSFPQRRRAIEDHEEASIRAESTLLQIRKELLADGGVLGRALPEAERLFLPIGRDVECDDETMIPDVHAVEISATRFRSSRAVPRQASSCAVVFATNRRLTALLLVPRLRIVAGTGSRLRAYPRVATPTSICSTTRRFNGSTSAIAWNAGSGTSWPSLEHAVVARPPSVRRGPPRC